MLDNQIIISKCTNMKNPGRFESQKLQLVKNDRYPCTEQRGEQSFWGADIFWEEGWGCIICSLLEVCKWGLTVKPIEGDKKKPTI